MDVPPAAGHDELAFGPFVIDAERVELRKNGRVCRIQPQPLSILAHLAERPGRLVTRDALRHAVWGEGVAVDAERGLNFAINQIRTVLGDSARQPRFIETVPRRGYRFVASVVPPTQPTEPVATSRTTLDNAAVVEPGQGRSRLLLAAVVVVLLATVALGLVSLRRSVDLPEVTPEPVPRTAIRIAVLPFEPLANPQADRSVAGSLTADLIGHLVRRAPERLAVIGRRSIQQFAGGGSSIAEAGRLLDVAWIVDGSVAVDDRRVRVQASLIDSATESVRWSERFDRDVDDLASMTDQIAHAVVTALEMQNGNHQPGISLPVNAAAYRLYAEGRFLEHAQTPDAWSRAAVAYRNSTELAPNFAPAYAALAMLQVKASFLDDRDRLSEARAAAEQALALDPLLAEGHFAAAVLSFHADRDLGVARQHFQQALKLTPGDALLLSWYAGFQVVDGDPDGSATTAEIALKLDPLSPEAWIDAGYADYLAGRLASARERFQRGLELGTIVPHFTAANIVNTWQAEGNLEAAAAAAERALGFLGRTFDQLPGPPTTAAERVTAYHEQRLAGLRAIGHPGFDYLIAVQLAALGRREEAIVALQAAFDQGDLFVPYAVVDPMLATLHDDRRVRAMVATMGLGSGG